jgi:hypothetical protein
MKEQAGDGKARTEGAVMALYQDAEVVSRYIDERLRHAWWRHLHQVQVGVLNRLIAEHPEGRVLEVAPGPARLAPDLRGVHGGVMVEASPQMIQVARDRLERAGLSDAWDVREGNAFDLEDLGGGFDLVYSFRFIRHLERGERDRIYRQLSGCMASGGRLAFDAVNRPTRTRLDARSAPGEGALDVFDVTYDAPQELAEELRPFGLGLESATPVLNRFDLQSALSYKLDDRLPGAALGLIRLIERLPSRNPLEWVVVFRKR